MKNLLKILFFVILICYIVIIIRNNIILNNLKDKNLQINTLSEYSVIINENGKNICKITKKNSKIKIENYITNMIEYYNSDTKKHIIKNVENQEVTEANGEVVSTLIELEWDDIFKTSLINFIKMERHGDEKIYKIQNYNDCSYIINEEGFVLEIKNEDNVYKYEYNIENINDFEIVF